MDDSTPQSNTTNAPSRRRWVGWLWFLIPMAAVLTAVLPWWRSSQVPRPAQWESILTHISKEATDHDGVYIYPTWYAAPWSALSSSLEKRGLRNEDALIHADPITDLELSRFKRIWVVLPTDEALPPPLEQATPIQVDGNVRLYLLDHEPNKVVFDFRKSLKNASVVRISPDGKEDPCKWQKDRHRCDPKLPFTDIRDTIGEIGNTRRRALFAHAWPNGGLLRITYPESWLGNSILVGVGLGLQAVRREKESDVSFRLLINGRSVLEQTLEKRDFSWHVHKIDTRGMKTPSEVIFEITTPEAHRRHVFFDALALP